MVTIKKTARDFDVIREPTPTEAEHIRFDKFWTGKLKKLQAILNNKSK